jgi:hypothetical protein
MTKMILTAAAAFALAAHAQAFESGHQHCCGAISRAGEVSTINHGIPIPAPMSAKRHIPLTALKSMAHINVLRK